MARKPRRARTSTGGHPAVEPMVAPESGVTVRMYRQGHGDCFLLAFCREDGTAAHMLIDCGLKGGSQLAHSIAEVVEHIGATSGGKLDVVVITHEHDDHVTGFDTKKPRTRSDRLLFDDISMNELWLAWTEDGNDPLANALRERFNDTLIGLLGASEALGAYGAEEDRAVVEQLLGFELAGVGGATVADLKAKADRLVAENPRLGTRGALLEAVAGITNKRIIKLMREKAEAAGGIRFLRPGATPLTIPGVPDVRIFTLGPPRSEELLLKLNPHKAERFDFGLDGSSRSFFAAFDTFGERSSTPFSRREGLRYDALVPPQPGTSPSDFTKADTTAAFIAEHYGLSGDEDPTRDWQRIDRDWLSTAPSLALRLNSEVNNTSLVLAIELQKSGKVLLFTGDAQRGSWLSWADLEFVVGDDTVTAKDLLARTILYKVGHHGSHNATLRGSLDDPWPNLSWIARSPVAASFAAMIPANEPWAMAQRPHPWKHPLESIREALEDKARGRVLQTNVGEPEKPEAVSNSEWQRFRDNISVTSMHIELTIGDE